MWEQWFQNTVVNCSRTYEIFSEEDESSVGRLFGGKNRLLEFESVNDSGLQVRDGVSLRKGSSARLSLGREQCCSVFRETGAKGFNRKPPRVKG